LRQTTTVAEKAAHRRCHTQQVDERTMVERERDTAYAHHQWYQCALSSLQRDLCCATVLVRCAE
jgi:hypothetical protein